MVSKDDMMCLCGTADFEQFVLNLLHMDNMENIIASMGRRQRIEAGTILESLFSDDDDIVNCCYLLLN